MTRGRENPACSITETGKRDDSVSMLPSHHSSAIASRPRGGRKERGGRGLEKMKQHSEGGTSTGHFLTRLGVYTANPLAFLVLIVYAALWIVFKPETFEWHAVATLATWGMTLVIQRAEHRDTQAIHAKLDEILHALGDARNEITRMDEKEPEEIERRREHMRKDD